MRAFRFFGVMLFVVVLFLAGCATPVRYTYEEIRHYPLDVQERIMKGEVSPGMTQKQVRYAWGSPSSVKILEPENGKSREEWIYSSAMGIVRTRLIFVDGRLMHIISTEPGIFRR
jgi:hypothetical protein